MRLKPWIWLLLLAIILCLATFGIARFRDRFVRSQSDLLALLPTRQNGTLFFVNADLLRLAHVLSLISAPKTEDRDYEAFVQATGFDYTRDLDSIAGRIGDSESDFAIRGRFDWASIESYARSQGGICSEYCSVPTGTAGRWISLRLLQSDVLAVAVSADRRAISYLVTKPARAAGFPDAPVWIILPPSTLRDTSGWPLFTQVFASSLRAAQSVTLVLGLHTDLELQMKAHFADAQAAQVVRNQLEIDTKMLKLELTREHGSANPADLTGLLTSGTFQLSGSDVFGYWPVDRQLLQYLQID